MRPFIAIISIILLSLSFATNIGHAAHKKRWQKFNNEAGRGAIICNSDDVNYSCFALRCGKGRGLEFAYLFSGGDIEDGREVPVFVDNQHVETLKIKAINSNSELVASYDPTRHGKLLKLLKSGRKVSLQLDARVNFSLRKSSKSLKRAMRMCAGEIRLPIAQVAKSEDTGETRIKGATDHVELLYNTDLPGFDYANGFNDPRLAGISQDQCRNYCLADNNCRAFTYNGSANICFLKSNVGNATAFSNATSGIVRDRKLSSADGSKTKTISAQELYWHENDTEENFVTRIREAAIQNGGECGAERAVIDRLQHEIKVNVKQTQIRVGETASVNWSGNTLRKSIPAYLLVTSDAPVRFLGKEIYALMPNAIGPFGMEIFKDRTRAIIPLYGSGAPKNGTIAVRHLSAGRSSLKIALVGYVRKCKETIVHEIANQQILSIPGNPIIVSSIPVDVKPNATITSPDGQRIIRQFEHYFTLEDASGGLVGEYIGVGAGFSLSGRFIVFLTMDRNTAPKEVGGERIVTNLLDSVDGKLTGHDVSAPALWDNHDSFVISDRSGAGAIDIFNPLLENSEGAFSTAITFNAATGWDETNYQIDLENNSIVFSSDEYLVFRKISGEPLAQYTIWKDSTRDRSRAYKLLNTTTILPKHLPKAWRPIGPMNASLPYNGFLMNDEGAAIKPSIDPVFKTIAIARNPTKNETLVAHSNIGSSGDWRSLNIVETGFPPKESSARLLDVGIDLVTSIKTVAQLGVNGVENHDVEKLIHAKFPNMKNVLKEVYYEIGNSKVSARCSQNETMDTATEARKTFNKSDISRFTVWLNQITIVQIACSESAIWGASWNETYLLGDFGNSPMKKLDIIGTQFVLYEGNILLSWDEEGKIEIIDLETNTKIFDKQAASRTSAISKLAFTNGRKNLLQQNSDGSFFIHRISDKETVLEGRIVDNEVVVWTPDMHFDSTVEGAHFVNLRFPGQIGQYTFQQFDSRLRVSGLVQQVLSGNYVPQLVNIGVPPRLEGSLSSSHGQIIGDVTPESLGTMREVRVYQDGILTDSLPARELGETVKIDVPRLPGARWVSMVAVDEDGLVSLPVGRDLGRDVTLPSLHVLAVGIDEYDQANNLNFAGADARTLLGGIGEADGKSINLAGTKILTDRAASPEAVLAAAEQLVANTRPGEQAVFFFAGHGAKGEDGRYYMVTSGTDIKNISGTALSWDKLASVLAKSKARMSVFIDACHSGAAGTDFFSTNDEAVAGILKNIPSGLTVFSASKGRELSEEHPSIGGGYFTHAVAQVIAGDRQKYDLNNNGIIEVSELYVGVKAQVVKSTNGRQTPWLARNQMIGDFALF